MQQHYLPKGAYLSFFEIPSKPDFIYFYQRGKPAIFVNTHKVAKEKHLYSFTDKEGNLNTNLEIALGEFEGEVKPLLAKLNGAREILEITLTERNRLMTFISLQAVRTPTFRTTLKQTTAKLRQVVMQMYASNKEVFTNLMKRAGKDKVVMDDISIDDLREFILDETRYTMEAEGDYFLGQQFQLQDSIFRAIVPKTPLLLRCEDERFITSDHPVLLISNPEVPKMYRGGFLMSDVLFPIGRNVSLVLKTERHPEPITRADQCFPIAVKWISPNEVRQINKITIGHAENYLFASENDENIQTIFDETTRPTRFKIHNPFERHKND